MKNIIINFHIELYRLNVSLYTDGGESPGALTTCTTLQDRPESVTSLDISERGRTYLSLNVTWNPPTVTNGILLCKLRSKSLCSCEARVFLIYAFGVLKTS